jgi:integrase
LVANGENVKVVQELMRHASSRFTLDVYSQARKAANRHAQQRVVQILSADEEGSQSGWFGSEPVIQ